MKREEFKNNSDFITDQEELKKVLDDVAEKANVKLKKDGWLPVDKVIEMFRDEIGFKIDDDNFQEEDKA